MDTNKRVAALCKKFRAGTITADELKLLDELEAKLDAERKPEPAPRSLFDLEVTRRCWEADARDLGA